MVAPATTPAHRQVHRGGEDTARCADAIARLMAVVCQHGGGKGGVGRAARRSLNLDPHHAQTTTLSQRLSAWHIISSPQSRGRIAARGRKGVPSPAPNAGGRHRKPGQGCVLPRSVRPPQRVPVHLAPRFRALRAVAAGPGRSDAAAARHHNGRLVPGQQMVAGCLLWTGGKGGGLRTCRS